MKRVCPCCGGDGVVDDEEDPLERLKADCRDMGIAVAAGGTITETDLARLLDKAPNTIRNWRMNDRPIEPVRIGGRVRYRLSDVALYLESQI